MSIAFTYHEELYRSARLMEKVAKLTVCICGAGALGANIAEGLCRQGFRCLRIVDRDRVEERNLSTQPYERGDIGAYKAAILANALYRALGAEVAEHKIELNETNAEKLLAGSRLVVDTFDNSKSRRIVSQSCRKLGIACLHAGMADAYGEVIWDDFYKVPSNTQDDICDYALARNLVLLTVAVACETAVRWAANDEKRSRSITLKDLRIEEIQY